MKSSAAKNSKKKSANKVADSLLAFLEAFKEVETSLTEDYGAESEEEIASGLVTELASATETIIDNEDFSSAFIASTVKTLNQALEELDPDIFTRQVDEIIEEDEDEDEDGIGLVDDEDYYEDR